MRLVTYLTAAADIFLALYGIASLSFFLRKKERKLSCDKEEKRRYAILTAARNEEDVIDDLLDALDKQDYPKELYDVYVIVNNCTDDTENVARSFGAKIIEGDPSIDCKAAALSFAFNRLKKESYDAYIIFDADNVPDKDFLSQINKVYGEDAKIIQGKRCGTKAQTSWVASCYRIYYAFQNSGFNAPRTQSGLSASLNGSGWLVDKKLIEEKGFDCTSITEDFEYTILMALEDERVIYCEKAKTCDEFPEDLKTSMLQRKRWSFGMVQCMRRFERMLIEKGTDVCFDLALVNLIPAVAMIAGIAALTNYIFFKKIPFLLYILVVMTVYWLILSVSALFAVSNNDDDVFREMKGILAFPLFIISWYPSMIFAFFKKDYRWVPIEHKHIEDIKYRK